VGLARAVVVVIVLSVAEASTASVIEGAMMMMTVPMRDGLQVHADAAEKAPLVAARGSTIG
jgi:hypothetical protein